MRKRVSVLLYDCLQFQNCLQTELVYNLRKVKLIILSVNDYLEYSILREKIMQKLRFLNVVKLYLFS